MPRGPGRVLGLDIGMRRIGVALSDSARTVASPYAVVERPDGTTRDWQQIVALVAETGATAVVVGLPLSLDGSEGVAARSVLGDAHEIAAMLDVPVETVDERLTTVEAERRRLEAVAAADSVRRQGRGARRGSAYGASHARRRPVVDDAAAAVLLQAWLDARSAGT
ncbi:MAG: Holliday junction resolvase RuvX [Acidimicrobiales bacterium]